MAEPAPNQATFGRNYDGSASATEAVRSFRSGPLACARHGCGDEWARPARGRERVGRGLHLGDVPSPAGLVDGVVIRAAFPVDEFPDDICVPGVLGRLGHHPDEQDAKGGVAPALGPVRHQSGCVQAEGGYDPVGISRGLATPGSPALWVVSDQRLYLFYAADARAAFIADPAAVIASASARWAAVKSELAE